MEYYRRWLLLLHIIMLRRLHFCKQCIYRSSPCHTVKSLACKLLRVLKIYIWIPRDDYEFDIFSRNDGFFMTFCTTLGESTGVIAIYARVYGELWRVTYEIERVVSGGSRNWQTGGADFFQEVIVTTAGKASLLYALEGSKACFPEKFWNPRPQRTHSEA